MKTTIAQIEKAFGEGSIMALGAGEVHARRIQGIPTGSLSLDLALGGVGLPKGRIIEIFGPESSGKTTLALHAVAQAQAQGALRRLSMPNMRWIRLGRRNWALIWRRCW